MEGYSSNSSISSASSLSDLLPNVSLASPSPLSSPLSSFFFYLDEDDDDAADEGQRLEAGFLDECGMCRKRMGAGREAYMYGGEAAFCSEECRREMMEMDSEAEARRRRAMARRCSSMKRVAEARGVRGVVGAVVVG